MMVKQPAFLPIYTVHAAGEEGIWFISEGGTSLLEGRAYALVAPLVNGEKTTDQIVELLYDQLHPAEVYYALLQMESKGYVMESDSSLSPQLAAFLGTLDIEIPTAMRRLRETSVAVTSVGGVDSSPLLDQLKSLSLPIHEKGDLEIVLTDDYLREELSYINQRHLESGRPWMLAKPVGSMLWIGPVFRPHETGCWACLSQRLRGHRRADSPYPVITPPAASQTGYGLVAMEAAKTVILQDRSALNGTLIRMNLFACQTDRHTLVRRPQCPVCGDPQYFENHQSPIVLTSHAKRTGEHRTVPPKHTLQAYGHHVSPITGIIGQLERSGSVGKDTPVHNYVAGINHAMSLRNSLRSTSGGKGTNALQAKTGALCEAIERFSARYQGDEIRRPARYDDLGDAAIHPSRYLLFSQHQYVNREQWNQKLILPGHHIPFPFDEERVIDWTPVWSLTEQRFKYLPTGYCFFEAPSPYFRADSNGCAAGNTLEEAILQGFMELVERDSVAIWWYNRIPRPKVDLRAFRSSYLNRFETYYRSLGREFWVLDITHDLKIPSFVAVSRAINGPTERILCGFGAHFDPEAALLRALTEMNQFLPSLLDWERGGKVDPDTARWWKTATVANQLHLRPHSQTSDFPRVHHDDILDDVLLSQKIVEQKGLEMLVLNQTRPDVGLPVVKVIVPGLRHFWNRFAPGRLYDVPVQMNWLPEPLLEQDLNPIPVFF
ncbi:MAG: TOMM precursor leader peptide-binding protein [Tumebacillaceae bacterium]